MNVTAQKFQSLYALVRKPSAWSNHRTTLPQSRPLGVTAPSEREPGMGVPFIRPPGNRNVAGDFHRPYKTQNILPLKNFRFLTQKRYRVGQGTYRMGTRPKRN